MSRFFLTALALLIVVFLPGRADDGTSTGTILGGDSGAWMRVNDNDPPVSYSQGFQSFPNPDYYDQDMHGSETIGEWCQFAFTGTGVKWIGGKNSDHGTADVFLDGKLDATLDTTAPTWLKQQEIYTKTDLPNGPHTLRIQIKTKGYQDFDAFEYQVPPIPPLKLNSILLPDQVPYLNTKHRYPLGNGVAMAVGEASGEWVQLCGPGYTSSNLIQSEVLALEVDGMERPLTLEMKRASSTGLYYGVGYLGDLIVRLIDYAPPGASWISRLVRLENDSTNSHDVRLRARIAPLTGHGMGEWLVKDSGQVRCGIAIQAATTIGVPFGGNNPANKTVIVTFSDPGTTAFRSAELATLETRSAKLAPNASYSVSLCHYFKNDQQSDNQVVDVIRSMNSMGDLEKSVLFWRNWFDHVDPHFRLSNVKDQRAHDLMEGALAVLKTNQSADGGIIAHSTFYKEGYVRDAALALRGLASAGHFDELKQWLTWVDQKLTLHHHLGDAMACEPSLSDPGFTFDYGNPNVEEPALVLLCARDYYNGTHDLQTLRSLDKSLRACMDVQLRDALANQDKLLFNGDETEICGAVDISGSGSDKNDGTAKNEWSLSSVAMCAASLDFYMKYLTARGEDPGAYRNSYTGTTMDLHTELAGLLKAMDRDFWRTDVPELPGGFHDSFRHIRDGSWPLRRLVNFTLMPVYHGTPYDKGEKARDVEAMAHYFNEKTGFLQLVPGSDTGFDGHDLGYLLWGLVETDNPKKDEVYRALVNGPTADCWGSFNEAYTSGGAPNDHDLRSLETGVNVSAIAKYWNLGK